MILILIDPAATLLGLDHQLVITKSGVDKRVNESARKVATC